MSTHCFYFQYSPEVQLVSYPMDTRNYLGVKVSQSVVVAIVHTSHGEVKTKQPPHKKNSYLNGL